MSRKTQRPILLFVAVALTLFALPQAHAKADTYELFEFTDYSGAGPVLGIDAAGDVLYRRPIEFCSSTATACYSVFQPFGPGYNTETLPSGYNPAVFDFEALTPLTFFEGNYEIYYDPTTQTIFGGPVGDLQPVSEFAIADFIAINNRDIAWTNGQIDENFLAYDLTSHETPEPATIALLLTGLIPITIIARRKLIRA